MFRTIWLALFCLVGLATIASVKFVSSALGTKVENPKVERASIGLNAKNEELVKADRLAVNVELASSETTSVIPIKVDPVDVGIRQAVKESIVSRHWHEPKASARSGNFVDRAREKKNKNRRKIVSVRPLKARCSDGKPQAFLQSVNRSPQCGIASRLAGKRPIIPR
jgi:hypothetical protein